MPDSAVENRLEWAREIAAEAGAITLEHFLRSDLRVERKGDGSPVTVADRGAEEHLRKRIAERFADDAILGEEFPEKLGSSGFQWVLDPIDGTKSFIHGVPLYTTLVAVLDAESGESVLGVIHAPAAGETVSACVGGGAWWCRGDSEPAPARVSQASLAEGLLLTTDVAGFAERSAGDATDVYRELEGRARLTRTWGDAFGYLLVATGRAEVMLDAEMNVWDAAALKPVLEEAGGTFTSWSGEPTVHAGEGLATNGRVADEVFGVTRGR